MFAKLKNLYRFLSPRFQTVHLDYPVNPAPRWGHGHPPHELLYSIINARRDDYASLLHEALKYREVFQSIRLSGEEKDPKQPAWNNGFFPGLDMVTLYTLIGHFRPAKYIEVGSGNSTRMAFKAIRELGTGTHIVSIDPHPRAEIDALADTLIRKPFEELDMNEFLKLKANDILFIDNSHRILPNSDATVFFLELFPLLPPGVIVHIHDIYLPFDYPSFMGERFYSEQYGLAIYLLAAPERYRPVLPNYFISQDAELSAIMQPVWNHPSLLNVETHGGSFWLRIAK